MMYRCKTLCRGAVLLVLFSGACTCGDSSEQERQSDRLYRAEQFGLTLEYPADWQQHYRNNMAVFQPGPQFVAPVSVALEVLSGLDAQGVHRTLDQVAHSGAAKLKSNKNFVLELDEKARLLQRPTRHMIVSFTRNGGPWKEELLYLKHREHFLGLYYLAPAESFDSHRPLFQAMLLSLKLE